MVHLMRVRASVLFLGGHGACSEPWSFGLVWFSQGCLADLFVPAGCAHLTSFFYFCVWRFSFSIAFGLPFAVPELSLLVFDASMYTLAAIAFTFYGLALTCLVRRAGRPSNKGTRLLFKVSRPFDGG